MSGKSSTFLILGGAALLILVLVVVANSSSKNSASKGKGGVNLSGGAGWLAGGGTLAEGIGKGIGAIIGASKDDSDGGYTLPARGDDLDLTGGGSLSS